MAYTVPTADELQTRYSAFADVADATVDYWIEDAQRFVDETWTEADYAPALMALAAHNMTLGGIGTDSASLSGLPAGVTRFKSGSFEASFTDDAANARMSGSFGATRYGQEYLLLLRRNKGGPRVQATGAVPYDPYLRYPQGQA
jgi:hypothetical protein